MKYAIPLRSIDTVKALWMIGLRHYERLSPSDDFADLHCPFCQGQAWMRTDGKTKNMMRCTVCRKVIDIVSLAMELRGLDLKGVKAFLHPAITKKAE